MDQRERGNYYDVIISGGGMIGGSMAAVLGEIMRGGVMNHVICMTVALIDLY